MDDIPRLSNILGTEIQADGSTSNLRALMREANSGINPKLKEAIELRLSTPQQGFKLIHAPQRATHSSPKP